MEIREEMLDNGQSSTMEWEMNRHFGLLLATLVLLLGACTEEAPPAAADAVAAEEPAPAEKKAPHPAEEKETASAEATEPAAEQAPARDVTAAPEEGSPFAASPPEIPSPPEPDVASTDGADATAFPSPPARGGDPVPADVKEEPETPAPPPVTDVVTPPDLQTPAPADAGAETLADVKKAPASLVDKDRSKLVFEQAKKFIEDDQVDKATQLLEEWLAIAPADAINRRNLIHVYVSLEKFSNAELHMRLLAEQNPDDQELWGHLGRAQARIGKLNKATKSLEKALELKPEDVDAALDLAKTQAKLRKFDKARSTLEAGLKWGKKEPELLTELGAVLVESGEYSTAYERYWQLQRIQPTYPVALILAQIAGKRQKCDDVQDSLAGWEKDFPDEAPFLLLAGCALKDKALLRTQNLLIGALEKNANCYDCALKLGDVYFENGQWEPAARFYEQASKLDPKDYRPFHQLAKAHANLGNHVDSARSFAAAAERDANNPEILYGWGVESVLAGNKADAWTIWGKLDELDTARAAKLKALLTK